VDKIVSSTSGAGTTSGADATMLVNFVTEFCCNGWLSFRARWTPSGDESMKKVEKASQLCGHGAFSVA
jgi:hypothetical protein